MTTSSKANDAARNPIRRGATIHGTTPGVLGRFPENDLGGGRDSDRAASVIALKNGVL
jgi:hypothetical protein